MKNIELLLNNNKTVKKQFNIKKLKFDKNYKSYTFEIYNKVFCGDNIFEIISIINYLVDNYPNQRIPIIFLSNTNDIIFSDKLVYVVLECICYYMIEKRKQSIIFDFTPKRVIWSDGIFCSPLYQLRKPSEFKIKFVKDLQFRHYRKILNCEECIGKELSELMQEIECFLRNNGVSEENSYSLSEMLTELVGNAGEHAEADTLIDIDLTEENYTKVDNQESNYYGMNTAIISFSPILFWDPLKEKMKKRGELELSEEYNTVIKAYEYHKDFFSDEYTENDFYAISSFQDHISGSLEKKMGGRGLTTLLKSIEEQTDTHYCYFLSGNTIIHLKRELLNTDSNGMVGFNLESEYVSSIPDKEAIQKISTFLPGTSFNLNFAVKKEW